MVAKFQTLDLCLYVFTLFLTSFHYWVEAMGDSIFLCMETGKEELLWQSGEPFWNPIDMENWPEFGRWMSFLWESLSLLTAGDTQAASSKQNMKG